MVGHVSVLKMEEAGYSETTRNYFAAGRDLVTLAFKRYKRKYFLT
jgi:hypothetical protein